MMQPRVSPVSLNVARPAPKVTNDFYRSVEWRELMKEIIAERGARCEECGRVGRMFGDHVVELMDGGPRLEKSNIMLLCGKHHTVKTLRVRTERMAAVHKKQ